MKFNWFLVLTIIATFALIIKISAKEENKIKVDLNNNETAITFILEEKLNALYIESLNESKLIILNYELEDKKIEEYLKDKSMDNISNLYTTNPVLINIFGITSEQIKPDNNLIDLKINNKNFCVYIEEYQTEPDLKQCNFLYIVEYKKTLLKNLLGNPGVIFQNENNPLPIKTQEQIYDDWTELYTINNIEYTILKISEEGFDTIIIQK